MGAQNTGPRGEEGRARTGDEPVTRSKMPAPVWPRRPRLLDLFSCSGIGALGYHAAGFDVYGIDIEPQPRYPFWFYKWDAVTLMGAWDRSPWLQGFDAFHASPPCQRYSDLAKRNGNAGEWPDLVPIVRDLLEATGRPYVIENVEGAPLRDPVTLCGTMFPELRVIRHRLFETNWPLTAPAHTTDHPLVFTHDKRKAHHGKLDQDTSFVQVTGGGNCTMENARAAMGLPPDDRRTKLELNEGIPAAYTEHIGRQLLRHLSDIDTPALVGASADRAVSGSTPSAEAGR